MRRLRQARKEGGHELRIARTILEASFEVRHAIIFTSLIEIGALLPVFVMEGLSGSFFRPSRCQLSLAILASMVVALTVTPALACPVTPCPLESRDAPLTRWLQNVYGAAAGRRSSAGRTALPPPPFHD